jgi:two-component system, NarL family, nitrate/nitrite response regulator NarL
MRVTTSGNPVRNILDRGCEYGQVRMSRGRYGLLLRIIVVEDDPLFREGLVAAMSRADDLEVVGVADDPASALQLARREVPDVVVLGMSQPREVPAAVRSIASARVGGRILVLTSSTAPDDLVEAIEAGAAACVLRDATIEEFVSAVRVVGAGGAYAPPRLAWGLLEQRRAETADPRLARLSPREREVLELVGKGLSDKEIALRLGLSPKTVAAHLSQIRDKLKLPGRLQVALFAQRIGGGT